MTALARKLIPADMFVVVLAAVFLSVVAANGVLVWLAMNYESQPAFSGSYCGMPGKAEGWDVKITPSARKPDTVEVQVRDGAGTPMKGVSASVSARQPEREEMRLAWIEDPIFPGNYKARFPSPVGGRWMVFFNLEQEGETFTRVLFLDIP